MVFLYTFLYDVKSLRATGFPTDNSTPGGIDRGVRPNLEGRFEVVEKEAAVARGAGVLADVACHAGTRNPGRVTGPEDEALMALPIAFPRLGVNMAAIGVDMAVVGVLQCCSSNEVNDKPMELNFLRLVMTSRVSLLKLTASGKGWPDRQHLTLFPSMDLHIILFIHCEQFGFIKLIVGSQ
jgi:hypothetical protein